MITSNVITRVFHIRYGQGTGTCFAIDVDEKQYLITAKHVIAGLQNGSTIELFHNGGWRTVAANLVGHHLSADVSVIAINQILATFTLEPSSGGIAYGQDTYFLGFPYRLQDEASSPINRDFPFPLVKKATLSAIMRDHIGNYLLLDGLNNSGFSGGPVVFKTITSNEFKVAAIISAYRTNPEPINYQNQPNPQLIYRANTGIIIAYTIENALQLISANPIGFDINQI